MARTAVLIGATGLVGRELLRLLLADQRFGRIIILARRATGISDPGLEEHLIDFSRPEDWQHLVRGDVLFSALGTTLKQAGSKAAQYEVDYIFQLSAARAAARNQVPVYVLVSSSGADPRSRIFYPRIKGELEQEVRKLSFSSTTILQPSLLVGPREHERPGERIAFHILHFFNALGLFKSYRPVPGKTVAQAMIRTAAEAKPGVHVYALADVFRLAE